MGDGHNNKIKKIKFLNNEKILFFIFLIIQSYISYNGVLHEFYFDIYDYNLNNNLFLNDFYFNETSVFKSSILFELFNLFNVNLHNDYVGYSIYLLSNVIGIYYLIKILKKNLLILNNSYIFLIIAILFYQKITLQYSQPVFFSNHTGTPTSLLMPLIFPYVYAFLNRDYKILIFLNCIFIFLSIRNFWAILFISHIIFLYNLIIFKKNIFYNISILITSFICLIIFYYLNYNLSDQTYNFKVFVINIIFERAGGEDNMILQDKLNLVKLCISFIIFYAALSKINLNRETLNFFYIFLLSKL